MGPGQYPQYTSAVKDGRLWEAQATDKAAKHHRSTTGTRSTPNFLIMVAEQWLNATQSDVFPGCSDVVRGSVVVRNRAGDVDVPLPQIQEQTTPTVKECP